MKFKIALAQTAACENSEVNIEKAGEMAARAAAEGAGIIVFPEIFLAAFPAGAGLEDKRRAAAQMDSPYVSRMRAYARENGIWVIFGMYMPAEDSDKNYNLTVVIDSKGEIIKSYKKTHLYDAFSYRESDYNAAGDSLFEPIDTPFGKIGLMVCYEVRFPEVARYAALKGADMIIMPTAWFDGEGKAEQLDILVRCRAIENTVFVAMCDMCGKGRVGESKVVGPLGNVICQAGSTEELVIAEVDMGILPKVRETVPSLSNRRPELYI